MATNLFQQFLFEAVKFDPDQFVARLHGVLELIRRGATEGEQSAARDAFTRLMARGAAEIKRMRAPGSGVTKAEVDRFVRALQHVETAPKTEPPRAKPQDQSDREKWRNDPPPSSEPKFRVGQWVVADTDVGKIVKIYRSKTSGTIFYDVKWAVGAWGEDRLEEQFLRPASQEDVDRAGSQRQPPKKFADDAYVFTDGHVGRIKSAFWDAHEKSWYYTVDALGDRHLLKEELLRYATQDEIDAAKPTSSRPTGNMEILALAHYENVAQNSNKIYGIVKRNNKFFCFWGGVNKAVATKQFPCMTDADVQFHTKWLRG